MLAQPLAVSMSWTGLPFQQLNKRRSESFQLSGELNLEGETILPIMPSTAYTWKFSWTPASPDFMFKVKYMCVCEWGSR